MTAVKLRAVDRDVPLVIPVGAIEQHGPHLPVNTDAFLAEHFARLLHRQRGDGVLILPVVSVGMSEHHMDLGGTLSVEHHTLFEYLLGILTSVAQHGHRKVLVLNAHGGNQAVATAVVEHFGRRNPECSVVLTTWWAAAAAELEAIFGSVPGGVGHAGELETSVMLHAAPDLVDVAAIRDSDPGEVPAWAAGDLTHAPRAFLYRTARQWSSTGIVGRPKAATSEKGAAAEVAVGDGLTEIIRSIPRFRGGDAANDAV